MADATNDVRISKSLSYWLRHRPAAASLVLDEHGWAEVDAVIAAMERTGLMEAREKLESVVATNDKRRFELSADGSRIRARQGHSVPVRLDWPVRSPPELLYHGTVDWALPAILNQGLRPMRRHHVHLSPDIATARRVGARRGAPVILAIRASDLRDTGTLFYLTANDVWLTAAVPPAYLHVVERAEQARGKGGTGAV